jgi:beta-glucosidase-like glycosyl hydrolase
VPAGANQARQLDLYSGNDIVTAGQLDWDRIERAWSLGAGGAVHVFYPHTAKEINLLQQWAKQKSRLGIPFLFIEECLHGLLQVLQTTDPLSLSLCVCVCVCGAS